MYKYASVLLFIILSVGQLFAQQSILYKGKVTSDTKVSLSGANILIENNEGILIGATISDANGNFEISLKESREYSLTISYIGFKSLVQKIEINTESASMRANWVLIPESTNLDEATVVGQVPMMTIKNDTVEFNADAFKVQENAVAEDLISKMPGMEVTDEGKLTAQGEEVKKVLVDGKEFFGEDPTIAMKNIPAEIIDKIQIIDELSDQAQFTGFDDGQRSKTLNIVTRQNMRNGYFGKINGGYGTDERYTLNGNLNAFKQNQKLTFIGSSNNVNNQNFSSQDLLGVGGNTFRGRGRGGSRGDMGGGNSGGSSSSNGGRNSGINTNHNIGINYSNIWKDKVELQSSYFYNKTIGNDYEDALGESYFSDTNGWHEYYMDINHSNTNNFNHRLNLKLEYQIDSANSLQLRSNLGYQGNDRNTISDYQSFMAQPYQLDVFSNLWNDSDPYALKSSNNSSNNKGYSYSGSLLFKHKFATIGRTFSVSLGTNLNDKNGGNYQNTDYLLQTALGDSSGFNNRITDSQTYQNKINSNMTYTEPMGENAQIMASYRFQLSDNNTSKITYDKDTLTLDQVLNKDISNKFQSEYVTQSGGLNYRKQFNKAVFMVGMSYQNASLAKEQVYPETVVPLDKNFNSWLPSAMVMYKFAEKSSLNVFYNTSTNEPSVNQLQNVIDDDDPLNIRSGNPDLKQEYRQTMMFRFNKINQKTFGSTMFLLAGSITNNSITNAIYNNFSKNVTIHNYDVQPGAKFTIPVNLTDPAWNVRTFFTWATPIKKLKLNINTNTSAMFNRNPGLLNDKVNLSDRIALTERVVINSNISKNTDFNLGLTGNYTIIQNTILKSSDNNYMSNGVSFKWNQVFFQKLFFNTEINYRENRGLTQGYNTSVTLMNAGLGTYLFKNKTGEFRISVYDLFNDNSNYNRNVAVNYIEDVQSLALNRFFIATFSYNLRNFKAPQDERRRGPGHGMDGDFPRFMHE